MSNPNPFETHGAFSWNELVTPDPSGSAKFYSELLGWSCTTIKVGSADYIEVKNNGVSVAGICSQPVGLPAGSRSQGWGNYITCDDALALADRVRKLGGTVIAETDLPGVGRIVVLRDPFGGHLGAIQYHRK